MVRERDLKGRRAGEGTTEQSRAEQDHGRGRRGHKSLMMSLMVGLG